jgi:RES domain
MRIDEADVRARSLATVMIGRELKLVDLTSRHALEFGVTGSMTGGADYTEAQAFASQVAAAGLDGIFWHVRHAPAHALAGVALFGAAGDQPDPDWRELPSMPIPEALVREANAEFGYIVLPRPI